MADPILTEKDVARFWSKTKRNLENGCLEWTEGLGSGYGEFWAQGRNVGAHRVAWALANGPVPAGMCVLHSCDNRMCVDAVGHHLFLGTRGDNNTDRSRKRRGYYENKTLCPAGHPYAGGNLYVDPEGSRRCRECCRSHAAARRATMGEERWREMRRVHRSSRRKPVVDNTVSG